MRRAHYHESATSAALPAIFAVIRRIPQGEYFFADYVDEDSVEGYPCRIAVNLIVKDGELVLDFTGTDPQLTSSINVPTGGDAHHALVLVPVMYVLYALDRSILLNAGLLRTASEEGSGSVTASLSAVSANAASASRT